MDCNNCNNFIWKLSQQEVDCLDVFGKHCGLNVHNQTTLSIVKCCQAMEANKQASYWDSRALVESVLNKNTYRNTIYLFKEFNGHEIYQVRRDDGIYYRDISGNEVAKTLTSLFDRIEGELKRTEFFAQLQSQY
jgi:hypothetical protein